MDCIHLVSLLSETVIYIYRSDDRVKGGRGLMAYFASVLPSKRLKQPRVFKTIEVLIIQSA